MFHVIEHNFFAALLAFERHDKAYAERRAATLGATPGAWEFLPALVLDHPPLHPSFARLIGRHMPEPTPEQARRLARLDPRCKHKLEAHHLDQARRANNPFVKAFAA